MSDKHNRKPFTVLVAFTIMATTEENANDIAAAIARLTNEKFTNNYHVINVSEGKPKL
jgi:hypothetical protein